jgi:hypothetical protein
MTTYRCYRCCVVFEFRSLTGILLCDEFKGIISCGLKKLRSLVLVDMVIFFVFISCGGYFVPWTYFERVLA